MTYCAQTCVLNVGENMADPIFELMTVFDSQVSSAGENVTDEFLGLNDCDPETVSKLRDGNGRMAFAKKMIDLDQGATLRFVHHLRCINASGHAHQFLTRSHRNLRLCQKRCCALATLMCLASELSLSRLTPHAL